MTQHLVYTCGKLMWAENLHTLPTQNIQDVVHNVKDSSDA